MELLINTSPQSLTYVIIFENPQQGIKKSPNYFNKLAKNFDHHILVNRKLI